MGAYIITNTILGVPYYHYSIMSPKTYSNYYGPYITDPKLVAFPSQKSRCINRIWTPRVCRIKAFYQDPPMAL